MPSITTSPRPDDEEAYERDMSADYGGMCSCTMIDPCPLGKLGFAGRCRANELRDALLKIQAERK